MDNKSSKEKVRDNIQHKSPMYKGMFIVIDGCDGSGKTTLAKRLAVLFTDLFKHVFITTEPTLLTEYGQKLRIDGEVERIGKTKELEYFEHDRGNHVENIIKPLLGNGVQVITDRYYHSTCAYQSRDLDHARELFNDLSKTYLLPNATFILDTPLEVVLSRLENHRSSKTAYETELMGVCLIYTSIEGENVIHLDATEKPDVVFRNMVKILFSNTFFKHYCLKPNRKECEPGHCVYRISGQCEYINLKRRLNVLIKTEHSYKCLSEDFII